tara:strand:+ start:864 stop:974 length:111 start_codon:yes stop_codon:yes gene_type:complete
MYGRVTRVYVADLAVAEPLNRKELAARANSALLRQV